LALYIATAQTDYATRQTAFTPFLPCGVRDKYV